MVLQSMLLTTVMTHNLATTLMSLGQRIRPHIPSQWHIDVGNRKVRLQWETKGLENELLDLLHNSAS